MLEIIITGVLSIIVGILSGVAVFLIYTTFLNNEKDFSWALKQLKAGKKVARQGWNGKGMFLFVVPGSTFSVNRPPLLGIYPEGTEINYHSHINMKTAQGDIVPWVASQSDLLSTDWTDEIS